SPVAIVKMARFRKNRILPSSFRSGIERRKMGDDFRDVKSLLSDEKHNDIIGNKHFIFSGLQSNAIATHLHFLNSISVSDFRSCPARSGAAEIQSAGSFVRPAESGGLDPIGREIPREENLRSPPAFSPMRWSGVRTEIRQGWTDANAVS